MSKVFVPEGFLNNTTVDSSTSGNSQTIKSNVYVPEGFLESFETEPSIIFFPGSYQNDPKMGSSLNLFCEFSNDNYYRAFNILTMK